MAQVLYEERYNIKDALIKSGLAEWGTAGYGQQDALKLHPELYKVLR